MWLIYAIGLVIVANFFVHPMKEGPQADQRLTQKMGSTSMKQMDERKRWREANTVEDDGMSALADETAAHVFKK